MSPKKVQPKRKIQARKVRPIKQLSVNIDSILVPIDFSEHSKNALKYAIPFAQKFKASIDLIYVVEPTIYPADFSFGQIGFPNIEEELRTRGSDELENLLTSEIAGRVPSRKIVRTGKPFYEINQYALEEKMSLIIIATHGHTGMEHILFGRYGRESRA